MKNSLRFTALALGLFGAVAAHATVVLSFGTTGGVPLTALTAPALGATTTISVYYTSTTAITSAEVFTAFASSTTAGTGATPTAGTALVTLGSPTAASNDSLSGVVLAGGSVPAGTAAGTARPYGLDIQGVLPSGVSMIPASATPAKLFNVVLTNAALSTGTSTLSFYSGNAGALFSTSFYDNNANLTTTTGSALVVTAPVPEPATVAALGFGALAMLRRRKRA